MKYSDVNTIALIFTKPEGYMKNMLLTLTFIAMSCTCSAEWGDHKVESANVNVENEHLSKVAQSFAVDTEQSFDTYDDVIQELKNRFGPLIRSKSNSNLTPSSTTSYAIDYQYTQDGLMLQQVAYYEDCVVCTNVEGPRKGAQFIIAHNGALIDMRNDFKEYKDHFVHKYKFAVIYTYADHQSVKFKK